MSPYDRKVDVAQHGFTENEKLKTVFFLKNNFSKFQKNEKCKFNTVQDDEKLHLQISPKYKKR